MREAMSPCGILNWNGNNVCHLGESDVKLLAILFAGQAEEFDTRIKQTPGSNGTPSRRGEGGQGGLLTYKKCARGIKLVAIQFALSLLDRLA